MKNVYMLFLIVSGFSFSQTKPIQYINSGAISKNVNCGIGEIFIPQKISLKEVDIKNKRIIQNEEQEFKFYPNPVIDIIYFETKKYFETIFIYSMDGKLIETKEILIKNQFNMDSLETGIYILKFNNININPITIIKN